MNDDLKSVKEETFFKIVFSAPVEMEKFKKWVKDNDGVYDYDKENSCQRGSLPKIEAFKDEICWCDIMTFYLLHIADYDFHSSILPYKGEVYIKRGPL